MMYVVKFINTIFIYMSEFYPLSAPDSVLLLVGPTRCEPFDFPCRITVLLSEVIFFLFAISISFG